ncbi:MAG: prephenate dehydrogenase/arogenate dehydrogenase family protein [Acidobacteria bacterium]|nr:prephenate dehydrogenase/arogenate dehydrogenase family protein [Acidobacteriota bacterium]MBV9184381.1 prephenate dehydrogenase/arogenate dehydrogenase family protein [Acidobacteriota bacterium]
MSARRALIAGLGLIGGSIGLALRRRGWRVAFFDSDPDLDPGDAADERVTSIDAEADVAILATPVDVAVRLLATARAPLITSVCSVMVPLRAVGDGRFIAGHPLAGSASRGITAARADLFEGATWFIDRDDAVVREIIAACGANAEIVDAAEHDRALAMTSHLPQILSTVLAAYLHDQQIDLRFAGPGLRTFLRLAASEASVWSPILDANRENLRPHAEAVAEIMRAIIEGDASSSFGKANDLFRRL